MMKVVKCKKIVIHEAIKSFGGFVRYFDTTEPLQELAALVAASPCRDILACCGGGDQALAMLGVGGGSRTLWAADINAAQLFVLAAKASFLKQKGFMPSFTQLRQAYPGKIAALKNNIRSFDQIKLCHTATGNIMAPPAALAEKYALVLDGEMFVAERSGSFWKDDTSFKANVLSRLGHLRFVQMDIFDAAEHFKSSSLDLIYISDIFWPEELTYYQEKLARLVGLLRPGGRIICYLDPGDDFLGKGISPGRMLTQQAQKLALTISRQKDSNYLVLQRMRRKR